MINKYFSYILGASSYLCFALALSLLGYHRIITVPLLLIGRLAPPVGVFFGTLITYPLFGLLIISLFPITFILIAKNVGKKVSFLEIIVGFLGAIAVINGITLALRIL